MQRQSQNISALNDAITQLSQKRPHLQPILDAFAPFLRLKHRVLKSGLFHEASQHEINTASLAEGIPLVQQKTPQLDQEVFEELKRLLLDAVAQGFPLIRNRLEVLASEIMAGRIKMSDLFAQPINAIPESIVADETDMQVFHLFMAMLHKLLLTSWRATIFQKLASLNWTKGYCPVCGSLPILSISLGKGRPWLYCGTCGHEWQFPWAKCPACEHESPEEAPYFFVEGEKDEKAFVCQNCNRYILSVRIYEDAEAVDLDLLAMGLTHLNILMQQRDIPPMTFCMWNDFMKR